MLKGRCREFTTDFRLTWIHLHLSYRRSRHKNPCLPKSESITSCSNLCETNTVQLVHVQSHAWEMPCHRELDSDLKFSSHKYFWLTWPPIIDHWWTTIMAGRTESVPENFAFVHFIHVKKRERMIQKITWRRGRFPQLSSKLHTNIASNEVNLGHRGSPSRH